MKNIKIAPLILVSCGIGIVLGILNFAIKQTLGNIPNYISGVIVVEGIFIAIFIINKLIKTGKASWLIKK